VFQYLMELPQEVTFGHRIVFGAVAGGNNTYAFGGSSPSASPNIQLLVIPIIVVILIVALIAVIIFKKKIASGVNRNGFV